MVRRAFPKVAGFGQLSHRSPPQGGHVIWTKPAVEFRTVSGMWLQLAPMHDKVAAPALADRIVAYLLFVP
jgi:hypothetical protein